MEEEGDVDVLMLEGGKHSTLKPVPLRESVWAGGIQQSDQEVHPFFAHQLEDFLSCTKEFWLF